MTCSSKTSPNSSGISQNFSEFIFKFYNRSEFIDRSVNVNTRLLSQEHCPPRRGMKLKQITQFRPGSPQSSALTQEPEWGDRRLGCPWGNSNCFTEPRSRPLSPVFPVSRWFSQACLFQRHTTVPPSGLQVTSTPCRPDCPSPSTHPPPRCSPFNNLTPFFLSTPYPKL